MKLSETEALREKLTPWLHTLKSETIWITLARDVGIALFVAVILTVVIEAWARFRLQEEVRTGVVEAAFRRLIAPEIFETVKSSVIQSKVARRNWVVEMNMYKDPEVQKSHPDYYVSQTTVSYQLYNATSSWHEEVIRGELDLDMTSRDAQASLPRFESLRFGTEPVFEKDRLYLLLEGRGCSYQKIAELPPNGYIDVVSRIREIVRVPDTFVWNTRHPTIGARVVIDMIQTPDVGFEVTLLHPDSKALVFEVPGRSWSFSGVFLPWQGFQIRTFIKTEEGAELARREQEWAEKHEAALKAELAT